MMIEIASTREEVSMKIIPLSRHRDRRMLAEFARAIGAKASGEHFERCVDLIYEARRGSAEIVEQFRRDTEQLRARLSESERGMHNCERSPSDLHTSVLHCSERHGAARWCVISVRPLYPTGDLGVHVIPPRIDTIEEFRSGGRVIFSPGSPTSRRARSPPFTKLSESLGSTRKKGV
jgi:hypothetical protein